MSNWWNQVYTAFWEELWKDIDNEEYNDTEWEWKGLDKPRWTAIKNTREWNLELLLNTQYILYVDLTGVATLIRDIEANKNEIYDLEANVEYLKENNEYLKFELKKEFGVETE